jgi:hypothetical protein
MNPQRHEQSSSRWPVLFELLRKTEPVPGAYDVEWWGPHFITRPRQWHRSRFLLYGGCLYGSLEIGWTTFSANWCVHSGVVSCQEGSSLATAGGSEELWEEALPQLIRRLRSALANPTAYNRRVQRLLPLEARTGRLLRKWTWPKGARAPLSRKDLGLLETACNRGDRAGSWKSLSSGEYFRLVGCMYNAAFPAVAGHSAKEIHASKADGRHGGLLDLSDDDPQAFLEWFKSRVWLGCHPWEIILGHPHGILFSPLLSESGTWRFLLSVETPGLYIQAVKMALALGETGAPFRLKDRDSVVAALRGTDDLEIGSSYGMFSLVRLREVRPEAIDRVRWDLIPDIRPITSEERNRVGHVLRTGSPAGWQARIPPGSQRTDAGSL